MTVFVQKYGILFGFFLFLLNFLSGCINGSALNPAIHDLKELLDSPAVTATVQNWTAEGDATNPSISFELYSGGRVRLDGLIARLRAMGDRNGGIDADNLKKHEEAHSRPAVVPETK